MIDFKIRPLTDVYRVIKSVFVATIWQFSVVLGNNVTVKSGVKI